MPPAPAWSDWKPLPASLHFTPAVLQEVLAGGQAFRWNAAPAGAWRGVFARHAVELRPTAGGALEFRSATPAPAAAEALTHYLGQAAGLPALLARLPLATDPVLAGAVAACPGLILLRQPLPEALLAFICSSTKRIGQIKQLCENLAARFGDELAPGIHALPTWDRLAAVAERDLRACALGFRARYVHDTARWLAARPGWLDRLAGLPYREAHAALCELPGVGAKVADCVLLFGAHRLEAFPVDVWILRALAGRYGLHGWKPAQVAHFGRVHFGPLAGLAQQYLFAAERGAGRRT